MYKPWSLQVPGCCWQPLLSRFIITSAGSCSTLPGGRFHTINSFLEHIWMGHFFLLDSERLSFVSVLSESPFRYWSFRSLAQVVSISPVLPLSSCTLWSSSYNGTQWTNHSVSRSFSSNIVLNHLVTGALISVMSIVNVITLFTLLILWVVLVNLVVKSYLIGQDCCLNFVFGSMSQESVFSSSCS